MEGHERVREGRVGGGLADSGGHGARVREAAPAEERREELGAVRGVGAGAHGAGARREATQSAAGRRPGRRNAAWECGMERSAARRAWRGAGGSEAERRAQHGAELLRRICV